MLRNVASNIISYLCSLYASAVPADTTTLDVSIYAVQDPFAHAILYPVFVRTKYM